MVDGLAGEELVGAHGQASSRERQQGATPAAGEALRPRQVEPLRPWRGEALRPQREECWAAGSRGELGANSAAGEF
jgi:hypothetical protein